MNWRKLSRAVHRDIGYTAAALVIAYAISGLAVNHIEDWNPSYTFSEREVAVGALPADDLDAMQTQVVTALELDPARVRGRVMESAERFRLFLPDGEDVRIDIRTGVGIMKSVHTRTGLYEVNMLHLNSIKGVWTWVADLFAIALLVLALTGLLINQGRLGLAGRGKWFLAVGLLIPTVFIAYIHYGGGGSGH
ncbi:MAG: PepSY-associated TM helix domain-containing protein [Myxococcota bacterium]